MTNLINYKPYAPHPDHITPQKYPNTQLNPKHSTPIYPLVPKPIFKNIKPRAFSSILEFRVLIKGMRMVAK